MIALRPVVYLIPVLLGYCCQCNHAIDSLDQDHGQDSDTADFRNLPCPNAEDIAPCICTYWEGSNVMDMDCTNIIADDQQLYDIFHSNIPFPKFRNLILKSKHLTTLSDTVFGDATFEDVQTYSTTLTYVGPNAFIKSVSTLRVLALFDNQLTDFPFETLSQYKKLKDFSLTNNPLPSFPLICSETLQHLYLDSSAFHEIPQHALDGLPNLVELHIEHNRIDFLAKGVFASLPKLRSISMGNTGLKHLERLQFEVTSNNFVWIQLESNHIETVDPDTFKGVQSGTIYLQDNMLTILPEDTWKPLMDAGVHLNLHGNDLTCGCDVAWLVLEPTYHPLLIKAFCHSGEKLVELDPQFFENFC